MYKNPALLIKFCSIGFFEIKNSLKLEKHTNCFSTKKLIPSTNIKTTGM